MKSLVLFVGSVVSLYASAQVNPWLAKGENPWVAYQSATTAVAEKKMTEETEMPADTLEVHESQSAVETESADTSSSIWTREVIAMQPDTTISEDELMYAASQDALRNYKAGGDFAVGFVAGLLINGFAIITVDPLYAIPTTKRETQAIERVVNDSDYKKINDEKLRKEVKGNVKAKKLGMTILGSVAGSLVQLGIIFALN